MGQTKNKYSIYYENNDKKSVYLEVKDLADCCFEIWETDGETQSRAKIMIPVEEWKKIVDKWLTDSTKKEDDFNYL